MINLFGLLVPVAYIAVLTTSLSIFSTLYRRRQANKAASLAPWFSTHVPRDIYFNLLYLDPSNPTPSNPTPLPPTPASPMSPPPVPQKVPTTVLKAALLHRAVEDVSRVLALQKAKPALASLLSQGKVGDDLWQRFLRAEAEMEEEIKDVVEEANAYGGNWGQYIFQSASEMQANGSLRRDIFDIQAQMDEDREWWEARQAQVRGEFMDELDQDEDLDEGGVTTIHVPANAAASQMRARGKGRDGGSRDASRSRSRAGSGAGSGVVSEDDGVIVEPVGKGKRRKGRR